MIKELFIFFLSLSTSAATAAAADVEASDTTPAANLVEIWGQRKEAVRSLRAGQSVMIRPEDETRFDTRVHLRNEANLTVPDTGRINASGFSLPRVRGQDARFTEVYLDGIRIQDPYVGFPFIDDLDLRAFGEMSIYVGNPPPSIPTISPNGAIAYRMFTPAKRRHQAGVLAGRPYGSAIWALTRHHSDNGFDMRIYGRQHSTSGQYSYYDDNATPYNKDDDRYSNRQHADRRGRQLLPTLSWQKDGHKVTGLLLWNDAKTSLPARLSGAESFAREYSRHRVGRLSYSYDANSATIVVPASIGLELGRYDDDVEVVDPTGIVLGSSKSSARRLLSSSAAINAKWQFQLLKNESTLYLRGESTDTKINASGRSGVDFSIMRAQRHLYAGADLPWGWDLKAEVKGMVTQQLDNLSDRQTIDTIKPASQSRMTKLQGSSAGLAWQPENFTLYGQVARVKRPPTLLEKFGDGALILDNPNLVPETTLHRELGIQWRVPDLAAVLSPLEQLSLRMAMFRDDTRDRIVLLPSIAQTLKAQNAVRTQISGVEVAGDVTAGTTTLAAGYANMLPIDQSIPIRSRAVPGIASHVATATLSQAISDLTLRWATRYQSQVWRDAENSIAVPGYIIHDATVDAKWSFVSIGFGVFNVTNQRRLAIEAAKTKANTGYTSYSDYAGMPLPGRQWRLSLSAAW